MFVFCLLTFSLSVREIVNDALELCEQGLISPHITETFSLENVNEALDFMEKHKSLGKVVLNVES